MEVLKCVRNIEEPTDLLGLFEDYIVSTIDDIDCYKSIAIGVVSV